MRVFVTGASGFIGSAVVPLVLQAGHEVLGLARTDEAADALARSGVQAHRGELTDLDSLTVGARACDGVIHLAYIHDFSQFVANAEIDLQAVKAMTGALEGSGKPFVVASGTMMMAPGRLGTENDPPLNPQGPRSASDEWVLGAAARGVRSSTVRLPPSVHDRERHGLISYMFALAREKGVSAYVGDGANRWPAVHRLDAARVFASALDHAAAGTRLHAVAEEGVRMHAIAEAVGERLGVPVRSLAQDEATTHFGWLGMFIGADNPSSSALTRERLGWNPQGPDLLTDIRAAVVAEAALAH